MAPVPLPSLAHTENLLSNVDAFVSTSHAEIALRQTNGSGVPLLFLHGNSSTKDVFATQLAGPLGQSHRCIAIDLPGHGNSSDAHDPHATYSIAGYADAVIEVLEALDIDQVVVVGWSLGGHVAYEMMESFPGVVGAFITAAPPIPSGIRGLVSGFRVSALASLLGTADLRADQVSHLARATVGSASPHLRAAILRTDGRARAGIFRSLMRGDHGDQRRIVETSEIPLAIVNGDNDPFVRTRYFAKPHYANLWSGTCHTIPGGHAPFIANAASFDDLLQRFAVDMQMRARALRDSPRLVYSG